ncbi:SpoIIE family protein phosphatase [Micromonospora sp. M12]
MNADAVTDSGIWFRVEAGSAASAVRRAAERLGAQVQMGEARIADLAIVAAELTSNLVKHADEGVLLLRPVRRAGQAGVELIAIDSGPGMADLTVSSQDGHSTTGTLGIGLGAIVRQASWFDGYSLPGRGPSSPCRSGRRSRAAVLGRRPHPPDHRRNGQRRRVRGPGRRRAAPAAGQRWPGARPAGQRRNKRRWPRSGRPAGPPASVVGHLHRSMSHTRGAALAVAELVPEAGVLHYAGLGNISGVVVEGRPPPGLVSLPGIAGHQRPTIREYDYPFGPGARLVMHSDGVVDRWRLADYPGLAERSPLVMASTLLRDAGVRRDDACVLVARSWE